MTYVILIIALLAIIYGANWFVDGAVGAVLFNQIGALAEPSGIFRIVSA